MPDHQKTIRQCIGCVLILAAVLSHVAAPAQPATESNVTRATLKNGLRVVIVRNTLAPVVTTEVNYLVGSNEAPEGFPGMAHALEHMMFRGSPGLSSAQLSNLIAAMGGRFNANTQQTVTQYYFTLPASDLEIAIIENASRGFCTAIRRGGCKPRLPSPKTSRNSFSKRLFFSGLCMHRNTPTTLFFH